MSKRNTESDCWWSVELYKAFYLNMSPLPHLISLIIAPLRQPACINLALKCHYCNLKMAFSEWELYFQGTVFLQEIAVFKISHTDYLICLSGWCLHVLPRVSGKRFLQVLWFRPAVKNTLNMINSPVSVLEQGTGLELAAMAHCTQQSRWMNSWGIYGINKG